MPINEPKWEDSAHASGETGDMFFAVRNDVLATLADADGDYTPLQVNAEGALFTEVQNPARVKQYTASVTATGSTDAGANRIHSILAGNLDGTLAHYLKIYDKATAADENDTPIAKIYLAANDTKHINFGDNPLEITNGISMRATTEGADNGTTAATANDVFVTLQLDS